MVAWYQLRLVEELRMVLIVELVMLSLVFPATACFLELFLKSAVGEAAFVGC